MKYLFNIPLFHGIPKNTPLFQVFQKYKQEHDLHGNKLK